jgi:hypothetical protein
VIGVEAKSTCTGSQAAHKQSRYRARLRCGRVVLRVDCELNQVIEALLRAQRLSTCLKSPGHNHRQRKTAFESDTGRSAWAIGTAHVAPHLPFAIAAGIGSIE